MPSPVVPFRRRLRLAAQRLAALAVAILALRMCLRGKGDPFTWVLLGLAPLALYAVISSTFRHRLQAGVLALWQQLDHYARNHGAYPWRAAFLFATVPALLLYLHEDRAAGAGDTAPVVLTAVSLVLESNADLDEFFRPDERDRLPYYVQLASGKVYSSYPAGMVTFALPVTASAWLSGANFQHPAVYLRLEKWTAAWVAAGSLTFFFLLALRLAGRTPALVCTLLLATGSVLYTTVAQGLWQHGGVIFWMLLALLLEFRTREDRSLVVTLVQAVACGMMLSCRLSAVLFLGPFGLWVLLRDTRRGLLLSTLAALAYAPWAWLYQSIYGTPFGPSTGQLAGVSWTADVWEALAGVLVSPGRGLFVYQPWLLLGLVVIVTALRHQLPPADDRSEPRGWQWMILVVAVLYVGMVAAWRCWWGGYSWGSRLLADVVPLLALLCVRPVAVLWDTTTGRRAVVATATLAFLLHYVAIHYQGDTWNPAVDVDNNPARCWDWRHPPFVHLVLQ